MGLTPLAFDAANAMGAGRVVRSDLVEDIAQAASEFVEPIGDNKGTEAYKRSLARGLVIRAFQIVEARRQGACAWRHTATMVESRTTPVCINVNGRAVSADIEPRMLLVEFIREVGGLTGTHIGCDTSYCGACTVLLDGRSVKSCTLLALQAADRQVQTVEGLECRSYCMCCKPVFPSSMRCNAGSARRDS